MITTEKRFEADIESFFLSPAGGYTKGADTYDAKQGLYVNTLIDFVQRTQPKEWARFENANQVDPVRKFCTAFNTACETEGLLSVLRHGFKHRGLRFRVCYFKPESALNQAAAAQWAANTIECYISQILRMFDKELHKEYVFCCYLINLLPAETTDMVDLEGKLKLEYYKLQKTFAGSIELEQVKGVYEPAKQKGAMGLDTKSPLDEIIAKINEKYKGEFTEGDKVLLTALRSRLMADKKLTKMAQTSDPQIFVESIFPKAFGAAAQDSYLESQDTYTSLFEDQHKYNAIMSALADVVYREMRKS